VDENVYQQFNRLLSGFWLSELCVAIIILDRRMLEGHVLVV
jgi:hypothetical protein